MIPRILITVAAAMLLLESQLHADGKEISILLTSGELVKGELIVVRNEGLLIAREVGLSEYKLFNDTSSMEYLSFERIVTVTIKGISHVFKGALAGVTLGYVAGYLIAESAGNKPETLQRGDIFGTTFFYFSVDEEAARRRTQGSQIGALGGLAVGIVLGILGSQSDQVIASTELLNLQEFARYADNEPEFLKSRFRSDTENRTNPEQHK